MVCLSVVMFEFELHPFLFSANCPTSNKSQLVKRVTVALQYTRASGHRAETTQIEPNTNSIVFYGIWFLGEFMFWSMCFGDVTDRGLSPNCNILLLLVLVLSYHWIQQGKFNQANQNFKDQRVQAQTHTTIRPNLPSWHHCLHCEYMLYRLYYGIVHY